MVEVELPVAKDTGTTATPKPALMTTTRLSPSRLKSLKIAAYGKGHGNNSNNKSKSNLELPMAKAVGIATMFGHYKYIEICVLKNFISSQNNVLLNILAPGRPRAIWRPDFWSYIQIFININTVMNVLNIPLLLLSYGTNVTMVNLKLKFDEKFSNQKYIKYANAYTIFKYIQGILFFMVYSVPVVSIVETVYTFPRARARLKT